MPKQKPENKTWEWVKAMSTKMKVGVASLIALGSTYGITFKEVNGFAGRVYDKANTLYVSQVRFAENEQKVNSMIKKLEAVTANEDFILTLLSDTTKIKEQFELVQAKFTYQDSINTYVLDVCKSQVEMNVITQNEIFDKKEIDGVTYFESRKTKNLYYQQLGRGLHPARYDGLYRAYFFTDYRFRGGGEYRCQPWIRR